MHGFLVHCKILDCKTLMREVHEAPVIASLSLDGELKRMAAIKVHKTKPVCGTFCWDALHDFLYFLKLTANVSFLIHKRFSEFSPYTELHRY